MKRKVFFVMLAWCFLAISSAVYALDSIPVQGSALNWSRHSQISTGTKANWSFNTDQMINSSPAIGSDGTIYFGSSDCNLYALFPDGREKWHVVTGNSICSSPVIGSDETIYVCSQDGYLYAVDPIGLIKWKLSVSADISASPVVGNYYTIYLGYNNTLCAINPNGTVKWQLQLGDGNLSGLSPSIGQDGIIYVGSSDCKLYAVNPNGSIKWTFNTEYGMRASSPAIGSDGTIFIGTLEKKLYAINPDGTSKWTFSAGDMIESTPVIGSDGTVYFSSDDKILHAINKNGIEKWNYTFTSEGSLFRSSPVIDANNTIYYASDLIHAINPNGTVKGYYNYDYQSVSPVQSSTPILSKDGILYAGANDRAYKGSLYAIQLSSFHETKSFDRTTDPTSNKSSGTYSNSLSIELSCQTQGASIYYTTDGSTPTTSSSLYSTPITVSKSTTVQAIAIKSGMGSSNITVFSYKLVADSNKVLTTWIPDEDNNKIYAIKEATKQVLFYRLDNLQLINAVSLDYSPTDLKLSSGKLYISLDTGNRIIIMNPINQTIEKTVTTTYDPYKIAIDGEKIFYTQMDQHCKVVAYNLANNSEDIIANSVYQPDVETDTAKHHLYVGTSNANLCVYNTTDYSLLPNSTTVVDKYPARVMCLDNDSVYYGGLRINSDDVSIYEGDFNDTIIYTKGIYAFSRTAIYDTDKYIKINDLPIESSQIFMDSNGFIYQYNEITGTIIKENLNLEIIPVLNHTYQYNMLMLDEELTGWVFDEGNNLIYAISRNTNKLLYICGSDMAVLGEKYIGSAPVDICLYNGKIYVALSGATKIAVTETTTDSSISTLLLDNRPAKFEIINDTIFYWSNNAYRDYDIHSYSLTNFQNKIENFGFNINYPDLGADRDNGVLYIGQNEYSGYEVKRINLVNHSISSFLYQQASPHSYSHKIFLDDSSIYCMDLRLNKSEFNLNTHYNNLFPVYVRYGFLFFSSFSSPFVLDKSYLYSKDSNTKLFELPFKASLISAGNNGCFYFYEADSRCIHKFNSLEPAATSIDIGWTSRIRIPDDGNLCMQYRAVVKDQYNIRLQRNSIAWTLSNQYAGVSIDGITGMVTVNSSAQPGMIYVKAAIGSLTDTFAVELYTDRTTKNLEITSLIPNMTSPRPANTSITWTCTATGGTSLRYQFWVNTPGSGWSVPQDYSASNTFVWTPSAPGNYQVGVRVGDTSSVNVYDKDLVVDYTVQSALQSVSITSLSPDLASPRPANTPVTWTCTATGGTSLRYQFWVNTPGSGWSVPQDYSASNTFVWTPATPGSYQVGVRVKDASSVNVYDKDLVVDYTIQSAPQSVSITSLSPDLAGPRPANTPVIWTCTATGGTSLLYQFWVNTPGSGWSVPQDYSANNTFVWTPSTPGSYQVGVRVKDTSSANVYDTDIVVDYTIQQPSVSITSLSPNKTSPQVANTPVTWTCTAAGGTSLRYQFWVNTPGIGWSVPQDYSASNTFVWTPSTPGSYQVGVRVKDTSSANVYDTDMVVDYTIQQPSVSITSLTPNKTSPQPANIPITWTCVASGGSSLRYQFWVNTPGLGWWIPQDYSSSNTFVWTPVTPGNYQVGVRVKDASSANVYDMDLVVDYTIQQPSVSITSLSPNKTSPQAANTPVTWTCTATGGTSLLYQFWVNTPGLGWSIPQDYSASNTFVWTPSTPGSYQVGVRVKDASSANVYDMDMVVNYTVSPSSSVSITSLTPNPASPQAANTPVTWTCTATGLTSLRYQFWVNTPGSGWWIPQDYSASNTFAWTPSTPGSYQVGVRVLDASSINVYDMDLVVSYIVQ